MDYPLLLAELLNISKSYPNRGTAGQILDNLNFSVYSGDTIAIVGPSGSGKSTLLNITGLLDAPDAGIVRLFGQETNSSSKNDLAEIRNKHIGFVFQLHYLLPQLNLIENILVPTIPEKDKNKRKSALLRGMELLDQVGLSDKAGQLPGTLSVGECQRAAVVRALINQPGLVLADEPTGSLDHDSAAQLGELLSGLCKNYDVGLVVVTHSDDLASRMKKIYRLQNGKLISGS